MEKDKYIKQLFSSRKLSTYEEHVLFEDALQALHACATVDDVSEICKAFYNDTQDEEVMFGIIHLIEQFCGEQYLKVIAMCTPNMSDAHEWAMILNKRIINSTKFFDKYIEVINLLEKEYKEKILKLLLDVKNDNPQKFGEKIERLFNQVK